MSNSEPAAGAGLGGGLGYALLKAGQAWRREVAQLLQPHDVTTPQFLVLIAVYQAESHGKAPPTQRDIGNRSGMDPNTASQVIRGLQQRGLLERAAHPGDGRARALWLTPLGTELTATCSRVVRRLNDRFFGVLDTAGTAQLRSVLDRLINASEQRP